MATEHTPQMQENLLKQIEQLIVGALALARKAGLPTSVTDPLKEAAEANRRQQDMALL